MTRDSALSQTGPPAARGRRVRTARAPRHAADGRDVSFAAGAEALASLADGGALARAAVIDLRTGDDLLAVDDRAVTPIAGLGAVLLLIELAAREAERETGPGDALVRRAGRGLDRAPGASAASMAQFAGLFGALARGEVVDTGVSRRVIGWLALNPDLSMVASALGLDPLAHRSSDHGIRLANATGTDRGLRADAGVVLGPSGAVAYAVAVQFDDHELAARLRVLEAMRTVGADVLEAVAG